MGNALKITNPRKKNHIVIHVGKKIKKELLVIWYQKVFTILFTTKYNYQKIIAANKKKFDTNCAKAFKDFRPIADTKRLQKKTISLS